MVLKGRKLSIFEETIVNKAFLLFKNIFRDTIVKQKKDIIGIGIPGKHLFCYFIDKNDIFCVKFKNIKEHIEAHKDLSPYINETIELFKTNDFSTKSKSKQKKISIVDPDEEAILTEEEKVFLKIILKNIDPKTGETINISNESINYLNELFNKINSIKLQKNNSHKSNEPEDDINIIVLKDYKSGASLLDIFHQYNLSFDKIKTILKNNGIAHRKDLIKSTYKQTLKAIDEFQTVCNKGRSWTIEEEKELKEEYENYISITNIAKMHKRTKGGIKARLVRLGYGRFEGEIPEIFTEETFVF